MKPRVLTLLLIAAGIAALLAGCDSPIGGGSGTTLDTTFTSEAALDGDVNQSGAVRTSEANFEVGRDGSGPIRGFLSFNMGSIKPTDPEKTVQISSATLFVYQYDYSVSDPYAEMGDVLVDILYFGASLGAGAYNTPGTEVGVLSRSAAVVEKRQLSVKSALQNHIDAGGPGAYRPQFRLRHRNETAGTHTPNNSDWMSGNTSQGVDYRPKLAVSYKVVDK